MTISQAAIELLRYLADAPQFVVYDYRIRALYEANPRLLKWTAKGYTATDAGRAALKELDEATPS